jgi:hypothetical protein
MRHRPPAIHEPPDAPLPEDPLAEKRRRLGTALHQLARELAEVKLRNRQLERELKRVRAQNELAR